MQSSCDRGFLMAEGEGTWQIDTLTHLKASFLMVSVTRGLAEFHLYKLEHMQRHRNIQKGREGR